MKPWFMILWLSYGFISLVFALRWSGRAKNQWYSAYLLGVAILFGSGAALAGGLGVAVFAVVPVSPLLLWTRGGTGFCENCGTIFRRGGPWSKKNESAMPQMRTARRMTATVFASIAPWVAD